MTESIPLSTYILFLWIYFLKDLFVFLSAPLRSALFAISFLHSVVSCYFLLWHFPTPLSCPSFYFSCLSFSFILPFVSHSGSLSFLLSLWFSITLYQLCLLHYPHHCFFSCLMFSGSPGAEHFLLMWPLSKLETWMTSLCRNQRLEFDVKDNLRLGCFHLWQQTLQLPLKMWLSRSFKLSPEVCI